MHYYLLKFDGGNKTCEPVNMDKDCFKGSTPRDTAEKIAQEWVKERSGRRAIVVGVVRSFWSSTVVESDAPEE